MEEMNDELLAPIEMTYDEDEMSLPEVAKADMELPSLNHADIARDFLASDIRKRLLSRLRLRREPNRVLDRHAMGDL